MVGTAVGAPGSAGDATVAAEAVTGDAAGAASETGVVADSGAEAGS